MRRWRWNSGWNYGIINYYNEVSQFCSKRFPERLESEYAAFEQAFEIREKELTDLPNN
jgi:hypothetical protein